MGKIIGIDLGTTFSSAAYVNSFGKAEILPNREGERITPSVILFDDDMPIIGSIAKRSAVASPLNVAQFVKRQMGDPSWKFRTEGGDVYTPEELSAMILKRIKEDAENILGEPITDAVITVPAYFDDPQRKATQDAGRIAGLNVLRVINEPTAAALAYGLEKSQGKQTILVYDLGGGTFDVTIMRIEQDEIVVLATGGDKNLGGFDWDNKCMIYLNEQFMEQGGLNLFDDPTLEQDLRDKAEIAKKTLSSREKTKVFLSAGGKNVPITLMCEQFQTVTEPLLKRTANIMEFVLEDADLTWQDIDKILLVGGSTRMKAVTEMIESVSGQKPSAELHPDEVVAMGAALQGTLLQLKNNSSSLVELESFPLVEIKDVTSHSMGVVALNGYHKDYNSIILRKDTQVPCKVSDVYATVHDNQRHLLVKVTQGEDEDLNYVKVIAEATMEIPPYPKGAPVEVFFEYDVNGMLLVSVFDMTAGTMLGNVKVNRVSNLNEEELREKEQRMRKVEVN